jgi:hypothetical protein
MILSATSDQHSSETIPSNSIMASFMWWHDKGGVASPPSFLYLLFPREPWSRAEGETSRRLNRIASVRLDLCERAFLLSLGNGCG